MLRIKQHPQLFLLLLVALLLICLFVSMNIGGIQVSVSQLLRGLFVEYDEAVASIYSIRFPRIAITMLSGAALSVSGLLFQVVLRNPLADPGIIGISNGASLACFPYCCICSAALSDDAALCFHRWYGKLCSYLLPVVEGWVSDNENTVDWSSSQLYIQCCFLSAFQRKFIADITGDCSASDMG